MTHPPEIKPVDRQEQVQVHQHGGYEHKTQLVEDHNAGRRLVVSRIAWMIWLAFGTLEALIGLRILLKLVAANPANTFANLVYTFTDLFLWPFQGLTATPSIENIVLDIPAIIALFVYALLSWLLVRLVWLLFYWPSARSVRTVEREQFHE